MAMKPYTMEVPWAGSRKATISLCNTRIIDAIDEYSNANHMKKINAVARFMGFHNSNGKTVIKYRIESEQRG